jgi:HSP20 family protein
MSDNKFDPMKELNNLRDTVGKLVEKGSATAGKALEQAIHTVQSATNQSSIRVDVYEFNSQIIVKTSPIDNLVAESIEVSMENNVLTISGETREDETPAQATYLTRERKFGLFSRGVTLQIPVKAHEAKAKINKNSITVTLPIDQTAYHNINISDDEE